MDPVSKKQAVNSPEIALASEVFDQFCNANTLKSILGYYRQLCELLKVRPNIINQFYPKLKAKLRSWKAQALWKKFDQRANHKCYNRGKACPNTRVLIIGGGPCGLRTAIEAQLLGAKVVVMEKRDRMSRNNVLHLWPFVIQDLRGLGAKKFFGKFCAGAIDHISIRQLQCILLKVALILGVEFHESVSFDSLIQPPDNQEDDKIGWRAKTLPVDHPVSQYEFDVLIGADGKRNTLEGFKRKEFRGKLAIAITANFINKRTEAEARVEEISGVAFIFNQKFFKELYQETGIDLENIVYYKDDTHYFVMTAKKHSLIDKGVILQDHADTAKLLAKENVDREALMLYAREAAEFSTEYQMMNMEFAVNHYGQPDVAMFDFTSMYAAENASRILKRHGHRLLMILVGDSLLEPFWPTGSGCARGFLSSLDAGWAIKGWGASFSPLEVIAERESIYRLLGQTTPENLNRDYAAYTLDPHTRYPNLNVRSVIPIQVRSLLDADDLESIKQPVQSEVDIPKKRRRRDLRVDAQIHPDTLLRWLQKQVALYDKVHIVDMGASFKDGLAICAIIHRYRPDLINFYSLNAEDVVKNNQLAFDMLEKELNIPPIMTGEEMIQCDVPDTLTMFSYLTQIYEAFKGEIPYIKHPKLEAEAEECSAHPKQLKQLTPEEKAMKRHSRSRYANENVQSYMDKKDNIASRRSRKRRSTEKMSATMDRQPKVHIGYEKGSVDEEFSGRIKDFEDKLKGTTSSEKKPRDLLRAIGKIEKTDWNVKEIEKKIEENKMGRAIRHDRVERVPKWSREQFLARQIKMEKRGNDQRDTYSKYADIDNTLKNIGKKIREGSVLGHNKVSAMAEQFLNKNQDTEPKLQKSNTKSTIVLPVQGSSEMCHFCNKRVYLMERLSAEGKFFHRGCFRCEYCSTSLRIGNHTFDREKNGGRFYCTQHFGLSGTMKTRAEKKKINLLNKENVPNAGITLKTPEKAKIPLEGIVGLDLLDRGQTPERIEFENLAEMSDPEEAHSQMDEDEWTDRNFGVSTAEMGSSDDISNMSDSDEDDEIFEEAIEQPLTTEGTLELAKNWTLRYSYPHATIGQSDTGSNEYEDSSDEYTSEDDESGTATEDEEDIRARELRKQEVWLKMPPRSSDTDTGSETEVKHSQDSVDPTVAQESLISFESKEMPSAFNMNANGSESLPYRNNLEELLESSNEIALTSNESGIGTYNQDTMTSADKNGTSPNVIPQTSESVTNSTLFFIPANADDSISNPNRSLIFFTNIPVNNHFDEENYSSEYESFVDENVQLNLNGSDNRVNSNSSQNGIINVDTRNFNSNPIDLSININDSNLNDLMKNSLDLSINNLNEGFAQNNEADLKQVAKITLVDATSCTDTSKNPKVSDNETILNVDDTPSVIASSLNRNENCPSSSSSEMYQLIEILCNNSANSGHLDDLVEYSKSNLPEEVGIHKHEDICVINQSEVGNFINKNENIIFIDDSNNIHGSDHVADKKININAVTPMIAASIEKSVYPTVTVTSSSPIQETQLEELSLDTSKLLVPLKSHDNSNFDNCDSAFDKLKHDLQQRKERNKAIENGLRPLSTESARLKMSKYFTENQKLVSKCRSARNEEADDTSKMEVVKLNIKPRLSGKINAEEMLKYFNKTSSSNSCDKCEVSDTTRAAIKQNKHQKLEIDIKDVSNETINTIDHQFDQIEVQNGIAYMEDNGMDSQFRLSVFEIRNDEKETANDNLDLMYDELIELHPHLNDIDIDYVNSLTSNHNVPKLEDHDTNVLYSDIDLEAILKLHTVAVSDASILPTDIENAQFDITNNIKETEKINSTDNTLKNNINNIRKEEKVNVNLNGNMIDSDIIKRENIIKMDSETSILNSGVNEEKKMDSMYLDRIVLDNNDKEIAKKINILNNDVDKNKELNKNILFEDNIHINAMLIAPLLLNTNTDKAIKHTIIHKSDTNLNESIPRFFCKNITTNSKSLPELRDTICEDAKSTIIDKVADAAVHVIDTKITNDSIQNCILEVPKRLKRKHLSNNINFPKNNTIFYTESSPPEIPVRKNSAKRNLKSVNQNQDVEDILKLQNQTVPEIPVRKKSAKRNLKSLNQNQDVKDILKLQNPTVDDISKLCNQNSNNVPNIQSQDVKLSEIKAQDIKDVATLQSQDINNIPKIHHQDVSNIQNHDIKNIQKLPKSNVVKLQNENITNLSNLDNEIKKDNMDITTVENRNIADVKLENQSVSSTQKIHHCTNQHLLNTPEEFTNSLSYSSHSKKNKCVIS